MKPVAVGRRNYLFSNTIKGAETTVTALTLIETAKANDADSYYYLKYLLERMPEHINDQDQSYLEDMVPWSEKYRKYQQGEQQLVISRIAPSGKKSPASLFESARPFLMSEVR